MTKWIEDIPFPYFSFIWGEFLKLPAAELRMLSASLPHTLLNLAA